MPCAAGTHLHLARRLGPRGHTSPDNAMKMAPTTCPIRPTLSVATMAPHMKGSMRGWRGQEHTGEVAEPAMLMSFTSPDSLSRKKCLLHG